MGSVSPSPFDRSLLSRGDGLEAFLARYTDEFRPYGSGKAALEDGLAAITREDGRDDGNVCLPAYLPDAVAEPIREVGLEVRYYALETDLSPDFPDLESRIDADTVAVLSVNYFGFPQPGFENIASLAADYGCYHVDDNAHAAISVHEGELLGTVGHFGITSLPKLLPVPNGGLLYADPEVTDRLEASTLAEPNARLEAADVRYLLGSFAADVLGIPVDAVAGGNGTVPPPRDRYESDREPMSKLTRLIAGGIDVDAIRQKRRRNYRAWEHTLTERGDVRPVFETLPEGICPQVCAVYADDPEGFLADLEGAGLESVHTWPRLPGEVLEDPAHSTAVSLAERIVVLPVHQQVDVAEIEGPG
ncbi:DegT/DnrJ/EryC1/StrS family aminotransferase [Natrialbaceae archaeon A-gly3]